jgi:hypothetical protein
VNCIQQLCIELSVINFHCEIEPANLLQYNLKHNILTIQRKKLCALADHKFINKEIIYCDEYVCLLFFLQDGFITLQYLWFYNHLQLN